MSAPIFYQVTVAHPSIELVKGAIQSRLDEFQDWFYLGSGETWIVCVDEPCVDKISSKIIPIVKAHGLCFICRLDTSDMQGLAPQELWTWLRKSRVEAQKKV